MILRSSLAPLYSISAPGWSGECASSVTVPSCVAPGSAAAGSVGDELGDEPVDSTVPETTAGDAAVSVTSDIRFASRCHDNTGPHRWIVPAGRPDNSALVTPRGYWQ